MDDYSTGSIVPAIPPAILKNKWTRLTVQIYLQFSVKNILIIHRV